ncbi:MAG: D-alanyl-D-alanine carboxypeptidase [bacterium]|nr:D-alanyl-D-alanine carboxypeptidase [bacterium]
MRGTMQRTAAILMAALSVLALNGSALAERERDTVEISAGGVMLMDACTHKVLYAKNAHEKLPMASTTKIMTAILAIETGKLDALVTVPKEAYGVEGSSMYLRLGEKISLRDLVYGLMLVSGNDAAVAIAINVGGSIAGFAALMNEKAKELGAHNTHFVTPNGLHDAEHYTTAYDLALIASYAMQNETFREIVGTTYYRTVTGEVTRTVKNKNKILWEYEGGNGVKTGYTMAAGKCLVFSAERNGVELVGVVLNCPDMFPAAKRLLDYGFETYKPEKLVAAGDVIARICINGGRKNALAVAVKQDIIILVKDGDSTTVRTVVKLAQQQVQAPVNKGDSLGSLEIWEDGRILAETELVAAETIEPAAFTDYLERLFRRWSA